MATAGGAAVPRGYINGKIGYQALSKKAAVAPIARSSDGPGFGRGFFYAHLRPRLAMKTLSKERRAAIAEAVED